MYLAQQLARLPFVPFELFDWITRILPGDVVTFGIDLMIDTVAVDAIIESGLQRLVPIGGIAFSGARGISNVDIRVNGGPWKAAHWIDRTFHHRHINRHELRLAFSSAEL